MKPYSAYPDLSAQILELNPTFDTIPKFPPSGYAVNVGWRHLEDTIQHHVNAYGLILDPDYQRAHVWTAEQQTAYIEYIMMGGEVSKVLTFGADGWSGGELKRYELLDGKQRLEAVRAFLRDEVWAFGRKFSQYKGPMRTIYADFIWRVVEVKTRADVLSLYLSINTGGTPHAPEEIRKVQALLALEMRK